MDEFFNLSGESTDEDVIKNLIDHVDGMDIMGDDGDDGTDESADKYQGLPRFEPPRPSNYAYPKRKKPHFSFDVFMIAVGFAMSVLFSYIGWIFLEPVVHKSLYPDVRTAIEAKWKQDAIVIPAAYVPTVQSSSYYNMDAWIHANPSNSADGSIMIRFSSASDYYAFVKAVRSEIDRLIEVYTNDASLTEFVRAVPDSDYFKVVVYTIMAKETLINKEAVIPLLHELRVHALLFDSRQAQKPGIEFQNIDSGAVVCIMN